MHRPDVLALYQPPGQSALTVIIIVEYYLEFSWVPKLVDVDALSFAQSGRVLEGRLAASQCARLCQGLPASQAGQFDWRVAGRVEGSLPFLDVRARGLVRVVCQRCLEPFDLELQVSNTVGLVEDADALAAMEAAEDPASGLEYLVADASLDVQRFVEDELILVLPFSPRHDVCPSGRSGLGPDDFTRPSPFAALAQLKKH